MLTGERRALNLSAVQLMTYHGTLVPGQLVMTNYQLMFLPRPECTLFTAEQVQDACLHLDETYFKVPVASIDRIDRDRRGAAGIMLTVVCKDARVLRLLLPLTEESEKAYTVLVHYAYPEHMKYFFTFDHRLPRGLDVGWDLYNVRGEFDRQGVFLDWQLPDGSMVESPWRLSTVNTTYDASPTYPALLVVPRTMPDEALVAVAAFRSESRLPVLTWGDSSSAGSIWRSSQPKVGALGATCVQDEMLCGMVARAANDPSRGIRGTLHIIDCRPKSSANANKLSGHGFENTANYTTSKLKFMNISNIHAMRESHHRLLQVALNPGQNDAQFGQAVEDSRWLSHVRGVLAAAHEVASIVHEQCMPVLVHCSHGWDRTSQVSALAQLLLDPFFRTLEGFPVLVEKDFVSFGHPFQLRHAHGESRGDRNDDQMAPIFLQFLDAVSQLVRLFPASFEFNGRYLLCIAEHVSSCRFGTFLLNNERERHEQELRQRTVSLWSYLRFNRRAFVSLAFRRTSALHLHADPRQDVLLPPLSVMLRGVRLWEDYFLRYSPKPSFTHEAFTKSLLLRRGTLGDVQYDEFDLDTSRCTRGDLRLAEAACEGSDWDAWLSGAEADIEKWRVKALQEKMQVLAGVDTTASTTAAAPSPPRAAAEASSDEAASDVPSRSAALEALVAPLPPAPTTSTQPTPPPL